MKNLFFLLLFSFCLTKIQAQSTPHDQIKVHPKGTLPEDYKKNHPEDTKSDKPVPPPNNDGVIVDKRADKYYGKENLLGLPTEKKKQINYVFTSSYVLKSSCAAVTAETFDVFPYRYKRLQDKRITINLENGCGTVELLSQDEVDNAFTNLNK
jgi:hypothetical protein